MSETLMTDASTTTEGAPASSDAAGTTPATQAAAPAATQQQASDGTTQQAGNQPAADQPKGDQDAAQDKPAGAPEKYEFKAPDKVTLDESSIAAFSEVAKELNLSQEAAQKILDKVTPVMAQRQTEALNALNTQWVETVKSDKEIGGDKLAEKLAVAKTAMDKFGTPELRTLLNESRLGNHPEIIRAFYRAGKAISEDRFVPGSVGGQGARDAANALYPNQPH